MKNYSVSSSKKPSKKKPLIIVAAVLLAIITLLVVLELTGVTNFYRKTDNEPVTDSTVNYGPPTEEEQQAGDNEKQEIIKNNENQDSNQGQGSSETISVVITDAGQYDDVIEVRSFIPNHYEDGTCTITITQGNKKVEKSTPAYRDVSTTICTNPLFNRNEFPSGGDWKVIVSYSSPGASGSSDSKTISIQ